MDLRSLKLLLILCLLMFHSDLPEAQVYALPNRKMMMVEGVKEMTEGLGLREELRTVPSGPDPLHHHVNPPRQPRNQSPLP